MYKSVWDSNINVHPRNLEGNSYQDFLQSFQRVRRENFVKFADYGFLDSTIKNEGFCDVIVAPERFFKSNYAIAARKGFPFAETFNKR